MWGERRDLNPRSPGPQPGALTNLATLTIIPNTQQSLNYKTVYVLNVTYRQVHVINLKLIYLVSYGVVKEHQD